VSWEQLWCNAVGNSRTVNAVEDMQPICMLGMSTMDDCLVQMLLSEGTDVLR
jgi:hypothetical protein